MTYMDYETVAQKFDVKMFWAQRYIERGWPVFLLGKNKRPRGNCADCNPETGGEKARHSKEDCPCLFCHSVYAATLSVERVGEMLVAAGELDGGSGVESSLAIRCGRASGLVVLDAEQDVDAAVGVSGIEVLDNWGMWTNGQAGGGLDITLRQRTSGGGLHLVYGLPAGVVVRGGRVLPKVDVKAEGGYVVVPSGPGEMFADGGEDGRAWLDEWGSLEGQVTRTNDVLLEWLLTTRRVSGAPLGNGVGGAGGAGGAGSSGEGSGDSAWMPLGYVYTEAKKMVHIPDGWREAFARDMSYELRKKGYDRQDIEEMMYARWETFDQPPAAKWYMPWEDVYYKIDRDWYGVEPDAPVGHAWRPFETNPVPVPVAVQNPVLVSSAPAPAPAPATEIVERLDGADDGIVVSYSSSGGLDGGPVVEVTLDVGGDDAPGAGSAPGSGGDVGSGSVGDGDGDAGDAGAGDGPVDGGGGGRLALLGAPPPFEQEMTDTGNGHRFVRLFQDRALFVPGMGWHLWDGNVWRKDAVDDAFEMTQMVLIAIRDEQMAAEPESDHERALHRHYVSSSSLVHRKAMLQLASIDNRMKRLAGELDRDPLSLVVQNGTLDLKSGRLRASRPGDYNTQIAAVRYDEKATCPRWLEHIEKVTRTAAGGRDQKLEAFIQRWFGYTLTGLVKEQKFHFAYGSGRNGKNITIEALTGLLGTYAQKAPAKLLFGKNVDVETLLARLAGARMVFIDETPRGGVNESRVKELTGSNQITARFLYGRHFDFDMTAKIWISSNGLPTVSDSSEGFWRRLDLVPFDVTISKEEQVTDLGEILQGEYSGILNWALEGLKDYLEIGLGKAPRVTEASLEYRETEDIFGQFVEDTFVVGEKRMWWPNSVIHYVYTKWCEGQGMNAREIVSIHDLMKHLKAYGATRDSVVRRGKQIVMGVNMEKVSRGYVLWPLKAEAATGVSWVGDQLPREDCVEEEDC